MDNASRSEYNRLTDLYGWKLPEGTICDNDVSIIPSATDNSIHYPSDGNDQCALIEDHSYWFKFRNNAILGLLEKTDTKSAVWDVGAGNGFVSKAILKAGYDVVSVEPYLDGCRNCKNNGVKNIICGFYDQLRIPDQAVSVIGCFDVLEHIEYPQQLLQEFYRTISPGGSFLVSVPAFNLLWSSADDYAGHFRRHTITSLVNEIESVGFRASNVNYIFASMVIPMLVIRVLAEKIFGKKNKLDATARDLAMLSLQEMKFTLTVVDKILSCESWLSKFMKMPFGTSVIGIFRKPNN